MLSSMGFVSNYCRLQAVVAYLILSSLAIQGYGILLGETIHLKGTIFIEPYRLCLVYIAKN
jgi:hypothetical protein